MKGLRWILSALCVSALWCGCGGGGVAGSDAGRRFRQELRRSVSQKAPTPLDVVYGAFRLLSADMFPTAFADGVGERCRNDSRLYLKSHVEAQILFQPLWALQSEPLSVTLLFFRYTFA